MGLTNIYTPVRASGRSAEVWCLQWTFGATGAVTLDTDNSDQDQRIATPVADSGTTGKTSIVFPKCNRCRVLHISVEPATEGTASNYRQAVPVDVNAAAGTMSFYTIENDTASALADPEDGSIGRLVLLLDRS